MNSPDVTSHRPPPARSGSVAPSFPETSPPVVPAGAYVATKAVWDRVAAALLLIPALPVIGVCWLLVRLLNPGPGFYSQTRLGKDGVPYPIIKIRTMRHNVEKHTGGAKWSTAGDTRVFTFGKFLRKTHLDELPQLFNVLMGHMSLVGPRPERPEIIAALNLIRQVPGYEYRLMVKPGVTGLAQLQLPADSDILSVRNKVEYDLFYIERQSFWLDLRLVLATAAKAVGVGHKGIRLFFFLPRKDDVAEVFATRVTITDTPSGRFQPA